MGDELKDVFPRRLQQARTMRCLSLRGLETAMNGAVSQNALAKYERGDMSPGSEVLIALADALSQPVDFFFRPFRVEVSQVRFRKKSRMSVGRQNAVRELALDYLERYCEAEELVGDVRRFAAPLKTPPIRTEADAERAAAELREVWKLGHDPLPNVFELMESKGIKVLELGNDDDVFDGLSADTEVGPVVVIASHLNQNLPRKRMTEVHELGHVAVPVADDIDEKTEEKIIGAFAGAFLLPADSFIEEFGRNRSRISLAELIEMKARFGASIMAIMRRALSLGLIRESAYKSFCILASQQGWQRQGGEPGDDHYKGCESDGRFRQLVRRAVVEDIISLSKGAALLGEPMSRLRHELEQVVG